MPSLFDPIRMGDITLANRIVMAPLTRNRAVAGDRGFGFYGSNTNRLIYVLYVLGAVAVFPAFFLLIYGLIKAL